MPSVDQLEAVLNIPAEYQQLSDNLQEILNIVEGLKLTKPAGISLLDLKNQQLLDYCVSLTYLMILKADGSSIQHPVLDHLVESRLVLDKIKPLEGRLTYQIDKLLNYREGDMVSYAPKPENLVAEKIEVSSEKEGLYKPPRVAPVLYQKPLSKKTKETASRSRIMQDLTQEFSLAPEVIRDEHHNGTAQDQAWNDRIEFEEHNMQRQNFTKQDKKMIKNLEKRGGLMRFKNELEDIREDFASLGSVVVEGQQDQARPNKRKVDVGVISSASRVRNSQGGDAFKRDAKILKKHRK